MAHSTKHEASFVGLYVISGAGAGAGAGAAVTRLRRRRRLMGRRLYGCIFCMYEKNLYISKPNNGEKGR